MASGTTTQRVAAFIVVGTGGEPPRRAWRGPPPWAADMYGDGVFADPRLTNLYDTINSHAEDTAFYLDLTAELVPVDVVDLGCGTGRLALILAARGHRVTGVDPSPQMLAVARDKVGAGAVRWVDGGADKLGEEEADLVLMTGHVAQFFVREADWRQALRRIRRVLRLGGRLAFETRNPTPRPWEAWTPHASRRVTEVPGGQLETWYEVRSVHDGIVDYAFRYRFPTGEAVHEDNILVFRDQVSASLFNAGLEIERTYGDWDRSPLSEDSPELIYVARRA